MKTKYLSLLLCGAFAVSAQATGESTVSKTDVLGRHVSSVRNTPKAYVKDVKKQMNQKSDVDKPKTLARVIYHPYDVSIRTTYGAFEHRNGRRWYALDNQENLTESQYLSQINHIEDTDAARIDYTSRMDMQYINNHNANLYEIPKVGNTKCVGQESCTVTAGSSIAKNGVLSITYWNYNTVKNNSNLVAQTDQLGYRGNGIGIAMTEGGLPMVEYNHAPSDRFVILHNEENSGHIAHATNTARVLNNVAKGATVYGIQRLCYDETLLPLPVDGYARTPKIYIGNHSYGCSEGSVYKEVSQKIDDYIYHTRTIEFASAANNGEKSNEMSDVGMGVNVITVGAVRNTLNYHTTSTWKNPSFTNDGGTYVKPEVANFSDLLFPELGYAYVAKDGKGELIAPYHSLTSSASPYTAASVALLLSRFPFYKWHPEVVKALLITSSVKPVQNAEQHDKDNVDYNVAMGIPDGNAMFEKNRSRFWNGNNEDFFDSGDQITVTETNIKPNKKYRVAIAWLSRGSYVYGAGKLPPDLDLYVYQNGEFRGQSHSWNNSVESIECESDSDRPVTISISRYRNDGGRVLLGYNFVELPTEYQD